MEARSRRVGGGFPGYNGPALPRAMRSSRGRGQSAPRTSGYGGGRSGFFELLATVAGQILQNDSAGEEQDLLKLSDCSTLKQRCSDTMDAHAKEPELPGRAEKLQREPGSTIVSCLQSLGEAITNDEENNLCCEDIEDDDIGADSVHSVVNKPFLSRAPSGEYPRTPPETELKLNLETGCEPATTLAQEICDVEKQMTSSVSDNDENHTIKSDPDSSISNAMKHTVGFHKMPVDSDETIDSLQNPKAEDVGNSKEHEDEKEVESGIRRNENTADMEIDLPKASVKYSLDFNCTAQDPLSSTVTDVTKAELSSDEVTHPQSKLLKEDETVMMDLEGKMKSTDQSRSDEDVKPWTSREFYEKEDEGDSGLEVDDKSQVDTKKLLKVTDVILGKLEPNDVGAECGFLSGLILGNLRGRMSSKDTNCGSSKQMFQGRVSKKLKESYAKGMRARKVVKMVKRSRVSSSRSKRKHAEMEAGADSDEGLSKKAYYGGLSYTRQRTTRGFPAKRNKITDAPSTPGADLHVNTNLMDLGFECAEGEPPAAAAKLRSAKAASVASSPTARGCTAKMSKKGGESHVKLTIKSFTVPELSVDLPESATISSLKRAVMDAAMNLLGGGLRVRVLMQGKKVPDEGATLAQVGISRAGKHDSLGFMLEPSPMPTSPTSTSEDPLLVLSRAAGQPSPRYPVFGAAAAPNSRDLGSRCPRKRAAKANGGTTDGEPYGTPLSGDSMEGQRVGLGFSAPQDDGIKGCPTNKPKPAVTDRSPLSPHSTRVAAAGALAAIRAQADASRRVSKNESELAAPAPHLVAHESLVPGSGAIILHPGMNVAENMQGLALVPVRQKSHSMDVGKRRVRRPFSVAEVEALVHAVEKLGTGRWRDVKLRAFEQAKHRTYVDLKDKWKTLVHTARIAPHQRRGEPVPQDLLERVTRAHTYWTAQAAKQQAELDY